MITITMVIQATMHYLSHIRIPPSIVLPIPQVGFNSLPEAKVAATWENMVHNSLFMRFCLHYTLQYSKCRTVVQF